MIPPSFAALANALAADTLASVIVTDDLRTTLLTRRDEARLLVDDWIRHRRTSAWRIFDFEELEAYEALRFLITHPASFDQAGFSYCASSSMLSVLFTYFPKTMAQFAGDLIGNGEGRIGAITITAPYEMREVTREETAVAASEDSPQDAPAPVEWMLMSVLEYAMTEEEVNRNGLARGGATADMMNALLKRTGLFKDFVVERPVIGSFDVNHVELITKKDKPLREIFFGCDGQFVEPPKGPGSGSRGFHVFWLRRYEPQGQDIAMGYVTYGHETDLDVKPGRFVRAHAISFTAFTVVIDAAD